MLGSTHILCFREQEIHMSREQKTNQFGYLEFYSSNWQLMNISPWLTECLDTVTRDTLSTRPFIDPCLSLLPWMAILLYACLMRLYMANCLYYVIVGPSWFLLQQIKDLIPGSMLITLSWLYYYVTYWPLSLKIFLDMSHGSNGLSYHGIILY